MVASAQNIFNDPSFQTYDTIFWTKNCNLENAQHFYNNEDKMNNDMPNEDMYFHEWGKNEFLIWLKACWK